MAFGYDSSLDTGTGAHGPTQYQRPSHVNAGRQFCGEAECAPGGEGNDQPLLRSPAATPLIVRWMARRVRTSWSPAR